MKNKPRKKKKWKGGVLMVCHKDGIFTGYSFVNYRFKNGKIVGFVNSLKDLEMGALPSIIRLLKVDGWKVTIVFDTNEVREYDFSNKFEYWKSRPLYRCLLDYNIFSSIYFDEKYQNIVFPLAVTGNIVLCGAYSTIYDTNYLEKHGYKYKDENGYFEFYAIYGDEIYDQSVLIDPDFTHWRKENWWNKKKK